MTTFPSTLIISNSKKKIDQNLDLLLKELKHQLENNPDLFLINSDYSIKKVRQIAQFLSQKPFNHPNKVVVIKDADQMANPAQNALLKNLEEPGSNNFFILTTTTPQSLLPTIHSRCHIIQKTSNFTEKQTDKLLVSSGNIKTDLALAQNLAKDKDQVKPLLKQQLKLYHQQLIQNPNPNNQKTIDRLISCLSMLDHNVDPKSVLDYFLLS